MKTKLLIGISILFTVLIINSCENKQAALPVAPCIEDTTNLTYSSGLNTMQGIITIQCGTGSTSCHSPGSISTYDFSTYAGIYANYQNGLLYMALFGNGASVPQMPLIPQTGWDQCTLNKFKAWINQGCPQ